MNRTRFVSTLIAVCTLAVAVQGADCPRFRGPAGDGAFAETGLLKQWPEGGPKTRLVQNGTGPGLLVSYRC